MQNRHCPKCQTVAKEKWLEARKSELLPVSYFHNVFTLPHTINPIAMYNDEVIYNILFAAVSETLKVFGLDPKHIGGKLGFISILHTWDQRLNLHIHLHVVIPAGALSLDNTTWINPKKMKKNKKGPEYLFPVKALSPVFRAKFIELLEKAYIEKKLIFTGEIEPLGTKKEFKSFIDKLWKPKWVVFSKRPFAGPEQVLEYLGRYTHKIAISNHRIINVENEMVTFKYYDRKDGNKEKTTTVTAEEFIRRFLLHILPKGFMRIRHFGFLANKSKKQNLIIIRELLNTVQISPEEKIKESSFEIIKRLTGIDLLICPKCKKGTMRSTGIPEPKNDRYYFESKITVNTS